MLSVIYVALFQAAAGAPAEPADESSQSQPVTTITSSAQTDLEARRERIRDGNTRRCRFDGVTGSRLGARVCMTETERQQLEREARDLLQDHMRIADDR